MTNDEPSPTGSTSTPPHEQVPPAEPADFFEREELEEEDSPTNVRYSITSYGVDYPVDALVQRIEKEDILIPAFQRKYVWTIPQGSRFIESLLLGLPVPGIFLSKEPTNQKLLVIDGQQRLLTLAYFFRGIIDGREFRLKGVDERFNGLTFDELPDDDRRTLENAVIHATVVRQENPDDGQSGIYHIFERLNTGGTPLQPQEIRACVYHGEFVELLRTLSQFKPWTQIYGPPSKRARDQELILRFFALYYDHSRYERPMKDFLNRFMESNRRLERFDAVTLTSLFQETASAANQLLGPSAFRPERNLNVALTEAVFVGIAHRLQRGKMSDPVAAKNAYHALTTDPEYFWKFQIRTTDEKSVAARLQLAIKAFGSLT